MLCVLFKKPNSSFLMTVRVDFFLIGMLDYRELSTHLLQIFIL